MKQNQKILILDNIRSQHNVGSLFRSGDGVGVDMIYLVGTTPSPIDRFGRPVKEIEKTALGAEKSIKWEHIDDIVSLLKNLKNEGVEILALEQDEKSIDYKNFNFENIKNKSVAIILGNEVDGISKNVLERVDTILEIPMKGEKESLNVSVAGGIILYRLFDL